MNKYAEQAKAARKISKKANHKFNMCERKRVYESPEEAATVNQDVY